MKDVYPNSTYLDETKIYQKTLKNNVSVMVYQKNDISKLPPDETKKILDFWAGTLNGSQDSKTSPLSSFLDEE